VIFYLSNFIIPLSFARNDDVLALCKSFREEPLPYGIIVQFMQICMIFEFDLGAQATPLHHLIL
ncbi:MAG: hypothetical protein MJ147_09860, partial [Clostridia bacterium]|nr:hypothetical protein [Clostridia bacterium]